MAIKRGVKKKEHEELTDSNIEKVIGLLEAEKPITKKEACEILNISYNTARLGKIIEEYRAQLALTAKRRAANRGKPLADHEKQAIITAVMDGDSLTEIAKMLYRSADSIKRTIAEIGIPLKSESYINKDHAMLPDKCVKTKFEIGELVWSVANNTIAVVRSESKGSEEMIYGVYEFDRIEEDALYFNNCRAGDYGGQYANYPASSLGSLEHFKEYGIDLYKTYQKHFPWSVKQHLGLEK